MNRGLIWLKTGILIIVIQTIQLNIYAQDEKRFTVESGKSIAEVLSFPEMYRYPAFSEGKVIYQNGNFTETKLNYNIAIGEVQFLNSKNDTLIIDSKGGISFITILADTFYINDGYLEKIAGNNEIMLLVNRYVKLMDVKKEGAYGTSNSTAAIDSYTSINAGNNSSTYKLKANQDMVYSFKADYYFGFNNNEYTLARENSVLKLFPENKDAIKKFVKDQSINFNKKEDLIKLTGFLQGLDN